MNLFAVAFTRRPRNEEVPGIGEEFQPSEFLRVLPFAPDKPGNEQQIEFKKLAT